jgi:integrating conjugative element membrane protein (TIGR03747 family)
MDKRWNVGFRWWIKWALIIMGLTLIADYLHVLWPYPNSAIGVPAFKAQISDEWAGLLELSGGRIAPVANAIHEVLYTLLYKWPGLDYMITRAADPTPMDGGGEMVRRGVFAMQPYWGTATAGLQLFSIRLATLALAVPMLGLVAVGALSDGLIGWYRRRTGGGRESGFVFHRAKWLAAHVLLLLCFAYLVPPTTVEPTMVITSFAIIFAVATRVATASFKKYV